MKNKFKLQKSNKQMGIINKNLLRFQKKMRIKKKFKVQKNNKQMEIINKNLLHFKKRLMMKS